MARKMASKYKKIFGRIIDRHQHIIFNIPQSINLNTYSYKRGYLLFEFIIYMACSILLGFMLFAFISSIYRVALKSINRVNSYTKLIICSDRIAQDILISNDIRTFADNLIDLNSKNGQILWSVRNGKLIRSRSNFLVYGNLLGKDMSVIANNIASLNGQFFKQKNLIGYTISLANINNLDNTKVPQNRFYMKDSGLSIANYICLRTGIYL